MNKKPYHDKTIWIIGASTGIGNALSRELSDRGASLILSARSKDKLETLNYQISGKHRVLNVDVSNVEEMKVAAKTIQKDYKKLDCVIFLAAIYNPGLFETQKTSDIKKMIEVNLLGAFNVAQIIIPIFKEQKHGLLALCGSVAGYKGLPNSQPYAATKAGIISMAESLKSELATHNIDVKLINPGFVETEMTKKNSFPMPFIIKAEAAAKVIANDLLKKKFEIHFPKRFTYLVKLLGILPNFLFFIISQKLIAKLKK
jgi:short-subunit dehydrogenase